MNFPILPICWVPKKDFKSIHLQICPILALYVRSVSGPFAAENGTFQMPCCVLQNALIPPCHMERPKNCAFLSTPSSKPTMPTRCHNIVITQDNYWQLNMDIFCLRRALFGDENHGCQQRHQEPTSKDGPNRVANVVRRRMLNLHAQCGDHLSVSELPPKRKRFGSKQTSKINKKSTLLPYFVTLFKYPLPSYSDASTRNCIDPAQDSPTGHLGVSEIKKSSHICC